VNLQTKLAHPRATRISIVGVLAIAALSLTSFNAYADDRSGKDQTKDRPAKQQWNKGDKVYLQKNQGIDDHRRHGVIRYDGDRYRHHYGYHQRPYHYGTPRGHIHRYHHYRPRPVRIHGAPDVGTTVITTDTSAGGGSWGMRGTTTPPRRTRTPITRER
jgi:hypothetical protein